MLLQIQHLLSRIKETKCLLAGACYPWKYVFGMPIYT